MAHQLALRPQAQQPRRSASGYDQRLTFVGRLSPDDHEGAAAQVHIGDRAGLEFGAKARGLLAHILDELRPQDAIGKARIVFDHGRESQLPPGFVAVNHERLQVGAGGVDGSGEPGTAAADNDDVVHFRLPRPPLDDAARLRDSTRKATHSSTAVERRDRETPEQMDASRPGSVCSGAKTESKDAVCFTFGLGR